VRDFLNLQKDDVLYLEHEVKDPISIEVNGVQKFTGFQGAYKGKKAINIDELIYEPVPVDDMGV
jgi:flagellar motor switch protein FliM